MKYVYFLKFKFKSIRFYNLIKELDKYSMQADSN